MSISEYNECVYSFSDAIYRFILKQIKNEEEAKDIVQESYEKLWKNKQSVETIFAKKWLYTCAYRLMIDLIRKQKTSDNYTKDLQSSSSAQYHTNTAFDLKQNLEKAFEHLPDIQKTVLLLRDYEGYTYEEIATITKLNESQVKVYIYRARIAMQKILINPHFYI
jgi:RNA polymerase sigma factor (sigma-70 family)